MTFYEIRRQVAADVLNAHLSMPSRTIARILFTQYPTLFPKIEEARSLIRRFRGTNGEEKRKQAITNYHVRNQSI
jgi:hypothetical protein